MVNFQCIDARQFLRDASVDDELFDCLIQAMLDYAIDPNILGLNIYPFVDDLNARILLHVNEYIDTLDESVKLDLAAWFGADFEPVGQVIIEQATSPLYFSIPDVILKRGSSNSRVFVEHPELFAGLDKSGLVLVSLVRGNSQIGRVKDHVLHYHQLLRRSFVGNMNSELIEELLAVEASHSRNIARIALDERRIMPEEQWLQSFEKDHVYGPKNIPSEEWLNDPRAHGTVVKGDFEGGSRGVNYNYVIVKCECRGDEESNNFLKHFEIEERVSEVCPRVDGKVLIRYFHAIRNLENGIFTHCDGAVKVFDEVSYANLLENQFGGNFGVGVTKDAIYRKVFRVDGEISSRQWAALALKWFRGNELVREFLEDGKLGYIDGACQGE